MLVHIPTEFIEKHPWIGGLIGLARVVAEGDNNRPATIRLRTAANNVLSVG